MRIIRVRYQDRIFYASLGDNSEIICLDKSLGLNDPLPLNEIALLPPTMPTKVICVGQNYREHAEEMKLPVPAEPVLFLKPSSAVIGSGQTIVLPRQSARVDYEGELAIVIGKYGRNIAAADAHKHIFGYTCANDVTARDLQAKDGQYGRAKGFDTFCPVGPWIETDVDDPGNLRIVTKRNGEIRQDGHTSDMIFHPHFLVSFISGVMTLNPGDLILTGTPSGIGPMSQGDEIWVEIEKVGVLINKAATESDGFEEAPIQ